MGTWSFSPAAFNILFFLCTFNIFIRWNSLCFLQLNHIYFLRFGEFSWIILLKLFSVILTYVSSSIPPSPSSFITVTCNFQLFRELQSSWVFYLQVLLGLMFSFLDWFIVLLCLQDTIFSLQLYTKLWQYFLLRFLLSFLTFSFQILLLWDLLYLIFISWLFLFLYSIVCSCFHNH